MTLEGIEVEIRSTKGDEKKNRRKFWATPRKFDGMKKSFCGLLCHLMGLLVLYMCHKTRISGIVGCYVCSITDCMSRDRLRIESCFSSYRPVFG